MGTDWARLTGQTRREAVALAKRGAAHPDASVAAAVLARVRRLNQRERYVCEALVPAGFGAASGLVADIVVAGAKPPLWMVIVFFGAVACVYSSWWVPRILPRGGLARHAETTHIDLLLRYQQMPAGPLVIARPRGPQWTAWVFVAALVVTAWLGWINLHRPVELLRGILATTDSCANVLLLLGTVALARRAFRRWKTSPAERMPVRTPIVIAPEGLSFHQLPVMPWAEVRGVELLGPTHVEPYADVAVRWSLRARLPITITAGDMSAPPELVIAATRGYLSLHESPSGSA